MMTIEEKLKMYREKKHFIYDLSMAFIKNPKGHTVEDISYEVYFKEYEGNIFFNEWIIVHFVGGGKSAVKVNGNSNTANFRAVGELLDGGHYEEVEAYRNQANIGFKRVNMTKLILTAEE